MTYEVKSLNEECGVFGIWGHPQAAHVTYFGLHSLQHRGQEGAGIVTSDNGKLLQHRNTGLLSDVFKNPAGKGAYWVHGNVIYRDTNGNVYGD